MPPALPRQTLLFHAAGFLLGVNLTACATVAHGTTQVIPIVSTPSGARVAIDSVPIGETPILARVSRDRSHVVTVTRDSMAPIDVGLGRHLSAWLLGNMLMYYAPALIDVADGAAFSFTDDTVRVVFPGFVADQEMRRFGFASNDQIRFTRSDSTGEFI